MLIDSGADISMVPASAVQKLGLVPTTSFRVKSFGGTLAVTEGVELKIKFSGYNFTGQFLLTKAESGVIGRDILNTGRLILDGQNQVWEFELAQ